MITLYDAYTATDKIKQVKLEYSKNHSIKSQILFTLKNVNLLSVSKTYVNNIYLGVNLLFLIKKDFLRVFRDVNTGYSEELVNNLNELISFPHFLNTCNKYDNAYQNNQKITTESFSFNYQSDIVRCEKIFIDNEYCFSNFYTRNVISRGAYSGKGFTTGSSFDTVKYSSKDNNLIADYYKQKSSVNLSNTYSYVNTEYSTIKPTY